MVSHRSHIFFIFFHCFSIVLLDIIFPSIPVSPVFFFTVFLQFYSIVPYFTLSIYPSISSIFPVFCHGVTRFLHHYSSIISVCLTFTQMHLPQSLQLHRINSFARFFHGFFSVLLLHSGHTSKLQFFHCFSIVSRVLYAIMVPHRSLNFTWHHFTLSLFFPPFPLLSHFFFHCFMSKSLLFSIVFLIIFPSFPICSHCFMSYSLIFSIVFLIIFPSIAICPDPPRRADQGGIDTPTSPNCHLVHNPKKVYLWPPFLPPNFLIFVRFGALCPQTPLTHFVRKNNFA